MLTDEKKLALLIRQGDQEAFKTTFELYYAGLLSYGNLLINDYEKSRDLVQEVFLILWEKNESISVHTSLKAYLYTSVNNRALNHIRHEKIKKAFEEQRVSHWINASQDEFSVSPFLQAALEKAINNLPPKAFQCFALTQLDGLSIREAAQRLDLAEKTIENQVARSRKILRQKLKRYKT